MAVNALEAGRDFPPTISQRGLESSGVIVESPESLTPEEIKQIRIHNLKFVIAAADSEFSNPETIVKIRKYEETHPNKRLNLADIFNPSSQVDKGMPSTPLPVIDGSGNLIFRVPENRIS